MKQENTSIMQRAIGVLEGISFCSDEKISDAVIDVANMLLKILKDEEEPR